MHNLTRDGRVLRAVDADGTVVVLKKFAVGREDHMRRLYGQIALLHRLKHMHVVTVTGVFQTRESVYVRMPSYRGGDLESLLAGNGRPRSLHNVLRILGDVLLGVRFFHDQDLVHGDIKPSNIFLTRDGRAVLGDFDGVRVVNATMTIGGTIAYWAPELVSGTSLRFSKETDIYALGLVARRMFSGLEQPDFVGCMLIHDPLARLSIAGCLCLPIFASGSAEVERCGICFELSDRDNGLWCAENHFSCRKCSEGQLNVLAEAEARARLQEDGRVRCYEPQCGALPFSMKDLAGVVSKDCFDRYAEAIRLKVEGRVISDQERLHQEALDRLRREIMAESGTHVASFHARHIADEILTFKCPRCRAAYQLAKGCAAMGCTNCGAAFCTWYNADCGQDAHQHVVQCREDRAPGRNVYPPPNFESALRPRRVRLLRDYWARKVARLDEATRAQVRERLRLILAELQIDANQFDARRPVQQQAETETPCRRPPVESPHAIPRTAVLLASREAA